MLREALASIEQVRNENLLEVIVVDDGSSEVETTTILSQAQEAGYSLVPQPNCGLGAALNAGIRRAKGEFILALASDNRLRDAYLNEGVSLLKKNICLGVVYADAEYFGERTGRCDVQEFNLLSLIRGNFIDACALFRKKLWEEVGGYDEQMPWTGWEDWDFWLRVAYRQGTFVHLPKVGLFNENMRQLVDMEMWVRLMATSHVGYIPAALSSVRVHARQATSRHTTEKIDRFEKDRLQDTLRTSAIYPLLHWRVKCALRFGQLRRNRFRFESK